MNISSPIVPAIIPQSFDDLGAQLKKITGLPEVHIDVVDGQFTKSTSWPYLDNSDVTESGDVLDMFSLEVDLMVQKPLPAAREWLLAGADQLVFHCETISVEAFQEFTSECPVSVGISANNDTPLDTLYQYLPHADYVQCMGIAEIGSQGQPFDDRVITRIEQIHQKFPQLAISIDGSMSETTIPKVRTLSINRYIVGSAVMSANTPKDMYHALTKLALNR